MRCAWLLLAAVAACCGASRPCASRVYQTKFGGGSVCVCNATYCDDIETVGELRKGQAAVYLSTSNGSRLSRATIQFQESTTTSSAYNLRVFAKDLYQRVEGFGGAFTDSAGINLEKIGHKMTDDIIEAYFGENGIGYTIGRVPIASCDFSTHVYSYDETPGDFNLTSFKLTREDYVYKIPYIKKAQQAASGLRLFATPWSSPGWMKTSGAMDKPGELISDRNGPYSETFANYIVRFAEEYAKENISFWAVTPDNQPTSGNDNDATFQCMYMDAEMERDFIRDHLGPALSSSPATNDTRVIIVDDQRMYFPHFPDVVMGDSSAAQYVIGMGVHWYANDMAPPTVLSLAHDSHPEVFILGTEACNGFMPGDHRPILGNWTRAERYAYDIITTMNHWSSGWTDWNLVLDMQGGPNWANNFVDAPIIVNSEKGEYYRQPMFYALGHFSKFVRPGFHRVHLDSPLPGDCEAIAFVDPTGGRRVAVVQNTGDSSHLISFTDVEHDGWSIELTLPSQSLMTVVWEDPK